MSYSDRKDGNWDYQTFVKNAPKQKKTTYKTKQSYSYSAPATHTVDEVMADYNNWLSGQQQPKTVDEVMSDYNAWNNDEAGWMAAQTPVQTSQKKKKEEKKGPTRITFDPTRQERPEPTAITKGGIPELEITDPSMAYSQVVDYKEKKRKAEEDKASQEERHAKNKAARLEKQLERTEKAKARKDWTYKAPAQSKFPVYNAPEERQGAYSDLSDRELTAAIASIDPLRTSRMGFNETMQRKALGDELANRQTQRYMESVTQNRGEDSLDYLQRMQTQANPDDAVAMLAQTRRNAQIPDLADAEELLNKSDFTFDDQKKAMMLLGKYDPETIRKDKTLNALNQRLGERDLAAFAGGVTSQLANRYYVADKEIAKLTGGNNLAERTAMLDPQSGFTQNRIMAANSANAGDAQGAEMLNRAAEEASGKYDFKNNINATARDHGAAYGAGKMAGAIGENVMLNGLLADAGWGVNTGNKWVDFLGNQGIKLIPDILSDTVPEVVEAYDDGQRGLDLAATAAKNVAVNEALNLGVDYLWPFLKGKAGQFADNFRTPKASQIENTFDPLANADNAVKSVDNATPSPVELSKKNAEGVDELVQSSEQAQKNLEEIAEQAQKQVTGDDVTNAVQNALDAEKPVVLRRPETPNPVIDRIDDATRSLEESIPKAQDQLKNYRKKAGLISMTDDDWYKMVDAADNYARTGEKQYLDQMNDIVSSKHATDNMPSAKNAVPPERPDVPNVPVDEGTGPLRERSFAKDISDYRVEGLPDEVVKDFSDNKRVYKQLKNADTIAKAEASAAKGFNEAMNDFNVMLDRMDPSAIPLGQKLARDLSAQGDFVGAADIMDRVAERLTKSGQFSQAAVIALMKDDPLTALHYMERQINKLNAEGLKKFGKKWTDFALTKDELDLFSKIVPGDKDAIKSAYDIIGKRLGAEYPSTVLEQLLEGRRISMLLNSGTVIRNTGANIPTLGMRWAADRIDAIGQNLVHIIDPSFKVTNAVTGSGINGRKLVNEYLDSAAGKELFDAASDSKYLDDFSNAIIKDRTMFKGTKLEHWIDDMTGGGIQKLNEKLFGKSNVKSGLETLRNLTYKLLEAGDTPFVKENFRQRLGSYINAQGIKRVEDIPKEAIDFAWEEAMKATYKDNSWAVKAISGFRKGASKIPVIGKPLAEGVIPFVQAPGNIAARMIDYSPIRGSKGIYDVIKGATTKNHELIRRGIEEMSKGITGTGLVYLGMKLREAGILTGAYSTDKDEKAFQKQTGFQEFAIRAGDSYYTYDWAQPFAEALLVGTLLQDAIDNSDEYDSQILRHFGFEGTDAGKMIGGAFEGAKQAADSWFNASPLKGLRDLFGKNGYGEGDGDFSENLLSVLGGFAESFIPSSLNAAAKSIDTVQRNTYDPQNEFTSRVNAMEAKIPELSKDLPAKYDTWGREMTYADDSGSSALNRFLNPGKYSENKMTETDQEIERLYNETGNNAVFPRVAPKKVNDYTMNNYEMSEYQKDMGERSLKLAEAFIDSDFYKELDDSKRSDFLGELYGISEAITKRNLFDVEVADKYAKDVDIYEEYGAEAFIDYLKTKEAAKYKTENGNTTSNTYSKVNALSNLSDDALDTLLPEFLNLTNDEGEPTNAGRIYDQYGARTLIDFYQNGYEVTGRKELPKTKAEATEAALMFPKNMQNDMLNYYLNQQTYTMHAKTSKAEQEVLDTQGVAGLQQFVEQEDALKKYGSYTYDEKAQKIYQDGGIPALEKYGQTRQALEQAGAKSGKAYDAYEHARGVDPSITPKKFAAQYNYIDSLGNGDGDISQKEIIAAMNARPNDAQAIEALYWTSEKTIPVLKDGKWTTKKVNKKK